MFEGFDTRQIETSGTTINLVIGGSGPPLLLLHGYPQSHVMWHKIAPRLAQDFTVVAPDLRGYGDSGKPAGNPEHMNYSKRVMAQDQVDVMTALGFDRFLLVGHDRGARVSHRLTKDHPERVQKLATLDIIPTRRMFQMVFPDSALRLPGESDWSRTGIFRSPRIRAGKRFGPSLPSGSVAGIHTMLLRPGGNSCYV